ncbi:unnamed protein product [Heterobilharzia americana]|nr:unnamed protein product [Heterobilharzia americana]
MSACVLISLRTTSTAFNHHENEISESIRILGVVIIRTDSCMLRSRYRKLASKTQYMHFLNFLQMKYKRNGIRCLPFTVSLICFEECVRRKLLCIRDILDENFIKYLKPPSITGITCTPQ